MLVAGGMAYAAGRHRGREQGYEQGYDEGGDQGYEQQAPPPQQAVPYAPPPPAQTTGASQIEQLQQLGELHSSGVLTDEEFAAEKAKILGGGS
jgi:hypothetical protein